MATCGTPRCTNGSLPTGPGLAALAADEEDAEPRLAVATPVTNLSLVSASEGARIHGPWCARRGWRRSWRRCGKRRTSSLIEHAAGIGPRERWPSPGRRMRRCWFSGSGRLPGAPEAALRAALRSAALPVLGMVLNDARAADLRALESPSVSRPRPAEVVGLTSSCAG